MEKKLTSLGEVWPQRLYQSSHHLTSNWVTDANLCKPICLRLSTNLTKQIVLKLLFLKYKKKQKKKQADRGYTQNYEKEELADG